MKIEHKSTRAQGLRYYPIFLDIEGKRCVVVGGGKVAKRKIERLLEARADVVVISPDLEEGLKGKVLWIERGYKNGDLEGAFIAISATNNSKINQMVYNEAEKMGILINVVDKPKLCRFIVPSLIQRDDVTIAISTGGKDPSLAKEIRIKIEKCV
ncbi:MAG: bifunctional precorrin-2 dehydrogenase/sirohydrochlorin ferrochelatase [bacterium]